MMRLLSTLAAVAMVAPTAADVTVLTAPLDGGQQVPPVATGGTGYALVTVDDVSGYVHVAGSYTGLGAPATEAHLHGLAGPGGIAGVLVPLGLAGGTDGIYEGSANLDATQVAGILAGESYVAVHSTAHPAGEIRGQALHTIRAYVADLDGAQAGVGSPGFGTYTVTIDPNTRHVDVQGSYAGLLGTVIDAHLHGPAWYGQSAGIWIPLTHTGGTAGTFSGSATLTAAQINDVLDGFSYVNVHSSVAPNGEIRGQVLQSYLGTAYCIPMANSTGGPAPLVAFGSPRVVDNDVMLVAGTLPPFQFGYYVAGRGSDQVFPVPGSQGRLCIGGSGQVRFLGSLISSGPLGFIRADIDLDAIPASPPVAVQPGETWNFQLWYRDMNPGTTSNFSMGLSVSFR